MRVGTHEFEVSTEPYQDGWRAVAFLPGGKQRASATWDSKEAAEMDLYKQLKDEFAPTPKFDPNKRYEAKKVVHGLLDVPTPGAVSAALGQVKPMYHYYDVHVNFGGDEGYSAFIETTIAPPKGTNFGDSVQDDYVRERIISEAVRQGKVDADDRGDVDYVALVDLDEWREFNNLKEAEEPGPEHYLQQLPSAFDPDTTLERIQSECAYCMDSPEDKAAFLKWIQDNEDLFPDVAKALAIVQRNDSWCTDSEDDMLAFFEAIGFRREDDTCPKCGGTGEEPGAPVDYAEDGGMLVARCDRCDGAGRILTHCECDNTHQHNNTVCRWCWARGRRHFNDPPV